VEKAIHFNYLTILVDAFIVDPSEFKYVLVVESCSARVRRGRIERSDSRTRSSLDVEYLAFPGNISLCLRKASDYKDVIVYIANRVRRSLHSHFACKL
jgi:hypothetical protein